MTLSKNTQKATLALMGSMLGFIIAKKYCPHETYPFTLIGGFVGTLVGEEYIENQTQYNNLKQHPIES